MTVNGRVIFVGAGPGDSQLITVKGKEAIKKADVILYDYLVHPNMLLWAKDSAKLICVGKRKGMHSKTQEEINDLF